jgi:hypothetical protein
MLINAQGLLYGLKVCRIGKIDGRLGGGKTSLAFRLGYELVNTGYVNFITSNVSNVWNVYPDEWTLDEQQKLNALIILDEAGKFITTRHEASNYLDALRKINAILLAPSHEEAPPNFGEITIEFKSQLDVIGVPIWSYIWYRRGDKKNAQTFHWFNPPEIFGIYSTGEYVISDNGIKESLNNIVEEIHVENKRVYKPNIQAQQKRETRKQEQLKSFPTSRLWDDITESQRKIEELENAIRRIENSNQEEETKKTIFPLYPRKLR